MKYLINILLFLVLGIGLASADVTVGKWQYWIIMASVIGISINALLW